MDWQERIEGKMDKMLDQQTVILERSVRNEERINFHKRQFIGLWSLVTLSFGYMLKKLFFT